MKNITLFLCLVFSSTLFAQSKASLKLFKAIDKNDLNLASIALKEGADVNSYDNDKVPTTTALIRAVQLNRPEIVDLLLSMQADPNLLRPLDQHSALMIAANNNLPVIAEKLLNNNAECNLVTVFGRTALHIAALKNSLEAAEVLLKSKEIDVNVRPNLCALAVAARQGHMSMVLLLKKQPGSKASNPVCVEKAIELAISNGHQELVSILKR